MEWRTILNCDEAVGGKIKDEKRRIVHCVCGLLLLECNFLKNKIKHVTKSIGVIFDKNWRCAKQKERAELKILLSIAHATHTFIHHQMTE